VIVPIVRTGLMALRRDRGALAMSFILPVAFFSIFAVIFGGRREVTPRVNVIVVDEEQSQASQTLVQGLSSESLNVFGRPASRGGVEQPEYTAAGAEAAVKSGVAPVALVIPKGFGVEHPQVEMFKDSSDMVAPQLVMGLLQKVAMTAVLKAIGQRMGGAMPIAVEARDVVGEKKNNPMVSFYAAAIGVMFLLFSASAAGGSLLDEAESGTLDRVLSSRVTMGMLLAGKLCFCALLAFAQLFIMFVWAWVVFKVDLPSHLAGFVVMGLSTAFAVAAFGMLLASTCRTRAQLGPVSTLVVLMMSSIGGSMFPRFLMPEAMQKAGLLTINAWAIDGFTKVFWRDEPVSHLWPQVAVLIGAGLVLFVIARRLARRWEFS